ncbi:hypothetical protein BpHYR1_022129 [Brachionus plicatilis]|uniref:Uncharacterized protein n=1 Tax=Brachionus plicatilis TaxID=10195 RepID=A0A3M7SER4_BRAPC|nr:hypothetical protein BpHYR1_022129 [Brachionus plicatilis]
MYRIKSKKESIFDTDSLTIQSLRTSRTWTENVSSINPYSSKDPPLSKQCPSAQDFGAAVPEYHLSPIYPTPGSLCALKLLPGPKPKSF